MSCRRERISPPDWRPSSLFLHLGLLAYLPLDILRQPLQSLADLEHHAVGVFSDLGRERVRLVLGRRGHLSRLQPLAPRAVEIGDLDDILKSSMASGLQLLPRLVLSLRDGRQEQELWG